MIFNKVKYSEIGKIRSGKRLPKGYVVSENISNNKYIRVRDINNGCIDSKIVQFITDEAASNIQRYRVAAGDVIISVVGTVGAIAEIDSSLDGAYLTENCNNLLVDENVCLKKYLKYYLLSDIGKANIIANTVGSTQPKLPIYGIENFDIMLPDINTQKKIITILDSLNDKIILNNEINNNLYELSNGIHKNWVNERQDRETTNFINIKELGKIVMGQSPKGESYNYEYDGLPLINGAADYENGYLKAQKYTTKPTKVAHYGDLVFCIRATIGLLVVSDNDYCLGRGVASISNINELYKEYAFHIINNSIDEFKRMATGSVILGISREDIEKIKVIVPTEEEINKYHQIQKPLLDKMEILRKENQVLINLRDTLLPRLMNGEIDLDNIEI